jgi:flagellar biosynthesis/type III secretory pathway M-ring protein FliF/YscJ
MVGSDLARAYVTADYDFTLRTSLTNRVDPTSKTLLSEETRSSEAPGIVSSAGGATGTGGNIGFGATNAAVPDGTAVPTGNSTTKDKSAEYTASREQIQSVEDAPVLRKLSVAVVVDEGLADRAAEIESMVKAAVGFQADRSDVFSFNTAPLVALSAAEQEGEVVEGEVAPVEGSNPLLEKGLKWGLEVISALAFIVLLFKTLKGSSLPAAAAAAASAGATGEGGASAGNRNSNEPDPEALARAQIEELVRTDPRRVGQILSSWASETVGAGR